MSRSLLFFNGSIYTVNPVSPWAQAVVVRDGRIAYVGALAGAAAQVDADTERVDLRGAMLLPGFVDGHNHLVSGPTLTVGLRLDTYHRPDELLDAVAAYVSEMPGLTVIRGQGFTPGLFDAQPHREQLDAVTGDLPTMFLTYDSHDAWFNSAALRRAGVTAETPDPVPGFAYFARDPDGTPTGYVLEAEAWAPVALRGGIIKEGTEFNREGMELGLLRAPSFGITSYYDAGIWGNGPVPNSLDSADVYEMLLKMDLPVRIVGSLWTRDSDLDPQELIDTLTSWNARYSSDRLTVRVLKIFMDGTVQAHTGHLLEPYCDDPTNIGPVLYSTEALQRALSAAHLAGFDAHMHTDGDGAARIALDAIEGVLAEHGRGQSRYSIAHMALLAEQDVARFAELDVVANVTPVWASDYNGSIREFQALCGSRVLMPYGSLVRSGATVTFGSDIPGTTLDELSPLLQIQAAITRRRPGFPDDPPMSPDAERVSLSDAIRCYTCNGAYGLHMEDEIGSIKVGKRADLVVLERNLFRVPVDELAGVGVRATLLGGELTYGSVG